MHIFNTILTLTLHNSFTNLSFLTSQLTGWDVFDSATVVRCSEVAVRAVALGVEVAGVPPAVPSVGIAAPTLGCRAVLAHGLAVTVVSAPIVLENQHLIKSNSGAMSLYLRRIRQSRTWQ